MQNITRAKKVIEKWNEYKKALEKLDMYLSENSYEGIGHVLCHKKNIKKIFVNGIEIKGNYLNSEDNLYLYLGIECIDTLKTALEYIQLSRGVKINA